MAFQLVNLGTYANDSTGDDLRTAFHKVNQNLAELYSTVFGANIGSVPPTSGVEQGELWWSTVEGRLYVYYNTSWVEASPQPLVKYYDITAVAETGGASISLNDTSGGIDKIKFASTTNITVTRTNADTITLSSTEYNGDTFGTHTGLVIGNVTGNVTGDTFGLHTGDVDGNVTGNLTGDSNGTHTGPVLGNVTGDTFGFHTGGVLGNVAGNLTGNSSGTHTGPVLGNVTGNVSGNVSGNAGTVTNGVYTTSSINALADVDTVTTSPTNGQALAWNGTNWAPQTITAGVSRIIAGSNITINPTNGLGEVTISSPVSNVFDFGEFQQTFTDPISFLLDQVGVNFGTFTSPAGFNIDGGTF